MSMKTPSPGAVYNLGQTYYTGPTKQVKIGFNCDTRADPSKECITAEADMYSPKPEYGPGISIAKRFTVKNQANDNPGPIYDVLRFHNFQTGPSFSFGKNKGANRFSAMTGFLDDT